MHVPAHTYWFAFVQVWMQLTPSQVTVPPVGGLHTTPQVVAPQLLTSFVLTHLPPHAWYVVLHERPHVPLEQVAVPFASVAHFVQLGPQAVASLSAEQPVPHM